MSCKRKLGQNDNGTKNCLVLQKVMTVRGRKNCPILEPFVDRLLPASYPLLYFCRCRVCLNNTRTLCIDWGGALVAPICLTPLSWLQSRDQCIVKNHIIVPHTWGVWPNPPANVSRPDAQSHLVTQTTLFKFITPKTLHITHRNTKVGTIHRKETVVSYVTPLPVLEFNLGPRRWVGNMKANTQQTKTAYHSLIQRKKWPDEWPQMLA